MTDKIDSISILSSWLQTQTRSGKFSGVVMIHQNERVVFQNAYGYAARSWRVRNRLDTAFRTASVSKMLTAAAVLQLIEANLLAFETPVVERLGLQHSTLSPLVTIRSLLTMTAGIADWFEESGDWQAAWERLKNSIPLYRLRKNRDYLPIFASSQPNFAPGEKYRYSNSSYILLGLLIEAASGEDYFDYIQRHVLERVGMAHSGFFATDDVIEGVAEGYDIVEVDGRQVWKRNIYDVTPTGAGDGGMVSTAIDLMRFVQMLRADAAVALENRGVLLSPAFARAMLTPQEIEDEQPFRGFRWMYGFGNHFLISDRDEIVRWGHLGEEAGISCRLFHYPRANMDVIILGNLGGCAAEVSWKIHDWICE